MPVEKLQKVVVVVAQVVVEVALLELIGQMAVQIYLAKAVMGWHIQ
jgi:hypothetical protein